jgi:ADP-ribosylglycohydrolase
MPKDILDRVYGCLVGGAIGDALGAPIEGWYWTEIREKYGRLTELLPGERGNTGACYGGSTGYLQGPGKYDGPVTPPGAVTDDTTLRHYMCLAIVRKGGRITPVDFAQIWLEKLNPNRFWINERIVLHKLRIGMSPWDTGRGQPPTGCATMAIAPIGVINAGNPAQAYQDGLDIASINQDDVNRDAAATVAAGVAAAFLPGATVESVIAAMFRHSSETVRRALTLTMDLAYASKNVDDFAARFYARMLDWTWPAPPERGGWNKERFFSGNSLEFMPVVPAILHLCRGDVNQSIIEGANFGRDCDTIAAVAGNIAGVLQGASAIRQDWIDTVETGNAAFFEEVEGECNANFYAMAQRMVEALKQEQRSAEERARLLASLL